MTEMTAKRTRMMRTFSSCSSISDNNNWYETADSSFSDTNSCFDDEEKVGAAGSYINMKNVMILCTISNGHFLFFTPNSFGPVFKICGFWWACDFVFGRCI